MDEPLNDMYMRRGFAILLAAAVGFTSCVALKDPSEDQLTAPCYSRPWIPCIPRQSDCSPCAFRAPCEAPLHPDELVDIALSNNPQTKQSWHLARAAVYNLGASESALYPTVEAIESVTGSAVYSKAGSFAAVNDTGGQGGQGKQQFLTSEITLDYLLLDFGGRAATICAARQALDVANWTHNRTLQTVMLSVFTSYYNHMNSLGILDAREQDLKDARTNLDAAEGQFEMGVATRVDVLQAKSSYVQAKLLVETARGQVKTTMGQLATALGWPANAQVCLAPIPEQLPVHAISEGLCTLLELAIAARPDLAASYSAYLEAQEEVMIADSAGKPTLSLSGAVRQVHFFHPSGLKGSSQSGSIVLNVPLFAGFLYENQTASAEESAAAAYAAWNIQKETVLLDVVTSYYNYLTAIEALKYTEEYLAYAQEAYDAALEEYRLGTHSLLDLLIVLKTLSEARAQSVQARTQYLTGIVNVAYATGTL